MTKPNLKSYLTAIFLSFILTQSVFPFGWNHGAGSREKALAQAAVSLSGPFSVFHNQAFLVNTESVTAAIDYCQPYRINGLSEKAAAVILPASTATFAISLAQTGISGYSENSYGFVLAKSLGKRFSAGMQFNYFSVDFSESGTNKGTLVFEGGIGYSPSDNVALGLHFLNPFEAEIGSLYRVTKIPTISRAGSSIRMGENLLFVTELALVTNNPMIFKMGIECEIADRLFLRGGLSGRPISHSAGIGYSRNFFTMDLAVVHHETLGYTPSVSFIINIGK